MSLMCILYQRPDGRQSDLEMSKIRDEDADWFRQNNIQISLEDIGVGFCIYAGYGAKEEDGETPKEFVYVAPSSQSCEDAMAHIRAKVMELMK